ncbi:MAG: hypothetical protein BWX88_04283 [Planctomycetes bacterium ADurb.Bin126]|nr:MAG: hypothetical protein BWX88_04283 [Planctomycetes bacterium ADurb.Bin126]HOD80226.1 hypothetical protein [Phycisphaerae bacterium]HQL72225.1 hypothetical protein [Phycisphaerae bacterium]
MARRRHNSEMNFDSMMDTLTNVVGFLVLVLMLVQLGLGEAVERIRSIDPLAFGLRDEDVRRTVEDAEAQWRTVAELTARWDQAQQRSGADREELERLKGSPAEAVKVASVDLEQARKLLDEARRKAQELEKRLAGLVAEREKLKGQLDKTPARAAPPTKIVKLPNPRQPPKGATEMVFLCREGKVYWVDQDNLLDRAMKRTAYFQRQNRNKPTEVDGEKLTAFFDKPPPVQDTTFRLRIRIINYRPYAVFERLPNAGETAEQIAHPQSAYRRALRVATLKNRYARFIVWSDSFDAYLEARRIADEMDLPAGWEPTTMKDEWYAYLGGNLMCTDKPKPPPVKPQPAGPQPAGPPPRPPLPSEPID